MGKKYTLRHDKSRSFWGRMRDGRLLAATFIITFIMCIIIIIYFYIRKVIKAESSLEVASLVSSFLIAVPVTIFSSLMWMESKKAREASTDPVLIVHLGQNIHEPIVVTLNVSNVGSGAAVNVRLSVDKPNESDELLAKREFVRQVFKEHHPFLVIRQNESVEFWMSQGWNLLGENSDDLGIGPLPPFKAKLSYEDLAGERYEGEFLLDVREMALMGANQSPSMRAAKALERIADKIR